MGASGGGSGSLGLGLFNPQALSGGVTKVAQGFGFGVDTSASLGAGAGILGAAGMEAMAGGIGDNLIGSLIGGRGNQGGLGGTIGGGLGAGVGMFFGGPLGALIGGAMGTIVGGIIGSFFNSIKGSLKLRTSSSPTGFEHNNAKVEGPFGYVGPDSNSHDLDGSIAQFLTGSQIADVTKGLQSTEALKIKIGKKLSDGEFAQVLADRAITILNSLDIAVPEILKHAVASSNFSTEAVKMASYKAILANTAGLNPQLAELIKNFDGTFEKFKELANTVMTINKALPMLAAVFGENTSATT